MPTNPLTEALASAPLGPSIAEAIIGTEYALGYHNPRTGGHEVARVRAIDPDGYTTEPGTVRVCLVKGFGAYGFARYHDGNLETSAHIGTPVALADLHEWSPEMEAWAEQLAGAKGRMADLAGRLREVLGCEVYTDGSSVRLGLTADDAERLARLLEDESRKAEASIDYAAEVLAG